MTIDPLAQDPEGLTMLLAAERRARALAEEEAERAAFLARASAELAEALPDCPGVFARVARLAVPTLGDWCLVRLSRDGTESTAALAHADPGKEPLLAPLDLGTLDVAAIDRSPMVAPPAEAGCAPTPPSARASVEVVGPGEAPEAVHEQFASCFPGLSVARRALVVEAARAAGMSAFVIAPLAARGRCLGALIVVAAGDAARFGPADLDRCRALADLAAIAVDNAILYREARRAALAREDFLVFASHELRTPLASLQLAAQALIRRARADEAGVPAWCRPLLGAVERGALRLGSILDDLLDFSYLSGGVPAPLTEEVDLRRVVAESIDRYRDVLDRSGCAVTFAAEGPSEGLWDRRWLGQVTGHLLSNAAKYGRAAPVEVILEGREGSVRLTVRDHGVGIPAAHQSRIFERFERVAPPAGGGLGLGLWLVRRMVEGLGGTIGVESAPGEGAAFTVELPRAVTMGGPERSPQTPPGLRETPGASHQPPPLSSPRPLASASARRSSPPEGVPKQAQPPSSPMSFRARR